MCLGKMREFSGRNFSGGISHGENFWGSRGKFFRGNFLEGDA